MMRELATHADIGRLKSELTLRLGSIMVAGFVVVTAILGVLIAIN